MNRIEQFINEHGSIIVASEEPMEIGEITNDVLSLERGSIKGVDHPFVIFRECTKEEFLAQSEDIPRQMPDGLYFYEIRTD